MVDYNKIRKLYEKIKKYKQKLLTAEIDYKVREKLNIKIRIAELQIKIERIN